MLPMMMEGRLYQEFRMKVKFVSEYNGEKKFVVQKILDMDFVAESLDIVG